MKISAIYFCVLTILCMFCLVLSGDKETTAVKTTASTTTHLTSTTTPNCTGLINCTSNNEQVHSFISDMLKNTDMLYRALYVLIAITSLVVIYFVVKAVRLRRIRNKSRKYGLITTPGADLEMEPLDQGYEDDDDMTVFEVNGKPRR